MDIHLDNIKNKISKGKLNNFKVRLQYFLPKHLLTRLVGVFADAKMGKFTTWCIKKFIDHYNVNTAEMEGDIESFETFNDFFARPLKNYTRPIDKDEHSVVFPSDGRVSQFGDLTENIQLQAKGHYFTVDNLLGSEEYGNYFRNGKFATVYLSPRDYHRVHIPVDGILQKMIHIPGDLFFFALAGLYLGDRAGVEVNGINCLLSLSGLCIGFVLSSTVAHHIRRSHYRGMFSVPRQ